MSPKISTILRPCLALLVLFMLSSFSRAFVSSSVVRSSRSFAASRPFHMSAVSERKAGVASPEELKAFVAQAGSRLVVVDVRNPDASVEPGDQKSLAVAPVPDAAAGVRPQGLHLIYDRNTKSMPLPPVEKDTPMITHCGGGGRGQKAKDYLMEHGFTNVVNGGGPKETECWAEFGDK